VSTYRQRTQEKGQLPGDQRGDPRAQSGNEGTGDPGSGLVRPKADRYCREEWQSDGRECEKLPAQEQDCGDR